MHPKHFIPFLVLFICFQISLSAQNDTILFNQDRNETSKLNAAYFIPNQKKEKTKYIFKNYISIPTDSIHISSILTKANNLEAIGHKIKLTPIKIESYVNVDYSVLKPAPFEVLIYYFDDYGESEITQIIVLPMLYKHISILDENSNALADIWRKFNTIDGLNFPLKHFSKIISDVTISYKEGLE
jgi:hypothetical protein